MNRKSFLKRTLSGILISSFPFVHLKSQNESSNPEEPLPVELVKEFVVAGHGDLEKVKTMLEQTPNLLYVKYDWGSGDYESAIEGASHLGKRAIAEYLIESGARPNLFTLTMLGKTNLVVPILEAYPSLIQAKGAHGFTLLHHAKVGGEQSAELFEYLQEKGLSKTHIKIK